MDDVILLRLIQLLEMLVSSACQDGFLAPRAHHMLKHNSTRVAVFSRLCEWESWMPHSPRCAPLSPHSIHFPPISGFREELRNFILNLPFQLLLKSWTL